MSDFTWMLVYLKYLRQSTGGLIFFTHIRFKGIDAK